MTEQLQADHLDRYEGVQAEMHNAGHFDESNVESITYLGKVNMTRKDSLKEQE